MLTLDDFSKNYQSIPGIVDLANALKDEVNLTGANKLVAEGVTNFNQRKKEQAAENFKKAQQFIPDHYDAARGLINLDIEANNLAAAIEKIKPFAHLDNNQAYLDTLRTHHKANEWVRKGNQLNADEKMLDAKAAYEKAQTYLL